MLQKNENWRSMMGKLTINFGTSDGKKSFKNKEYLSKFISEQRSFWQSFFNSYQQNPLNVFFNHLKFWSKQN